MKISFVLSKAEQKQASKGLYRLQPKTSLIRVVNFCGSFLGSFLTMASAIPLVQILYERGSDVAEIIYCLSVLVIGIALLVLRRLLVTKIGQDISGIFGSTYSYEVTENSVICIKNGNIKTEIFPPAIQRIVVTPNFLYIYVGEAYAYFIPTSAFPSHSEQSEFFKGVERVKARTANTGVDFDAATGQQGVELRKGELWSSTPQ